MVWTGEPLLNVKVTFTFSFQENTVLTLSSLVFKELHVNSSPKYLDRIKDFIILYFHYNVLFAECKRSYFQYKFAM